MFLRNLEVVAFADAGTAWFGKNPFDQNSPLNTTSVSNPKVTIDLVYARDPLVRLWYRCADVFDGLSVESGLCLGNRTREILKPRFYISLAQIFKPI
ncbi:MAG: hypothetical protein IPK94_05615 [Saprospiraceae bacterium]|nr:hypothetical protein [Saprospiraceae bacterium]